METVYSLFSELCGYTFFNGVVDCEEKALRWVEKKKDEAQKNIEEEDPSGYYYLKEEVK